ncbi:MAG TPA: glycosyl hydrolase, partial [Cytophagaceae bacterium]|nr:glycosyl hydrolase [Cytophagaceae bacterium]
MNYGDFHADFQQIISSTPGQTRAGNILQAKASQGSPFTYFTTIPSATSSDKEPTFLLFFFKPVAISTSGNSVTINRSCCPSGSNQMEWGYTSLFFPPGTTVSYDNGVTYQNLNAFPLNVESGGNNVYWKIKFSNPNATNYFTTAIMSDSSKAALDFYEKYAFNQITGSTFSYSYNEPTASLTSTFNFTTTNVLGGVNNGTLMTLFMHQYLYSPDFAANATPYTYTSSRGLMKVMTGNQFTTVMQSYGILPGMGWACTANKTTLNTLINNYAAAAAPVNIACGNPVYGSFQAIHEAARIALIAHQSGNFAARNTLLAIAKNGVQGWLASPNGKSAGTYLYDSSFNYLTPYPSAFDADRLLQDSHFHHGYLIFAAAIVAKFEPAGSTWVAQWGDMINLAIRNINSEIRPSATSPGGSVPWLPYLRFYDPYSGHSWAGSDGSNQESVSEAINFAAGVAMWGETTGNTSLRDMGLMMFITETEAARMYWWDGPRRGVNNGGNCGYAPGYGHWHGAILGTGGVAYSTYFGANVSYVHGITYLPITGASIWMGADSLGAANQYADFLSANGGEPNGSDGFWDVCLLTEKAVFNAAAANTQMASQAIPGNWSGLNWLVEGYSWTSTFDSVGVIDPTITANTASFAVFRKNNCKIYMVYNPRGRGARTVTFSDGQSFNVPADTIITYKVCPLPLPVSFLNFTGNEVANVVTLNWSTVAEQNASYFDVEKSCDGIHFEKINTVKASGNSNTINRYSDVDLHPCSGKSYYRLKQVDLNNAYSYTKIIMVDDMNASSVSVIVYPNPFFGKFQLTINSIEDQVVNYKVFDLLGKTVLTESKAIQAGNTTMEIDLSSFPSGNYNLEIQDSMNERNSFFKMVKIN